MGLEYSDRYLDFAEWMSIGTLSVAILLLSALPQATNSMTIFVVISIAYGSGLVAGVLLAELGRCLSDRAETSHSKCSEAQR
jgi:hypothetical protein